MQRQRNVHGRVSENLTSASLVASLFEGLAGDFHAHMPSPSFSASFVLSDAVAAAAAATCESDFSA